MCHFLEPTSVRDTMLPRSTFSILFRSQLPSQYSCRTGLLLLYPETMFTRVELFNGVEVRTGSHTR